MVLLELWIKMVTSNLGKKLKDTRDAGYVVLLRCTVTLNFYLQMWPC